jgi:hypothetical protein
MRVLRRRQGWDIYQAFQTIPICISIPARAASAGWGGSCGVLALIFGCGQAALDEHAQRFGERGNFALRPPPIFNCVKLGLREASGRCHRVVIFLCHRIDLAIDQRDFAPAK